MDRNRRPHQLVLTGDIAAQIRVLREEHKALKELVLQQQTLIQNILYERSQSIKVDWEKRRKLLDRVRDRLLGLIIEYPGLTYAEYQQLYTRRYRHTPRVGNRIRELRQMGLVYTIPGPDKKLRVYPKSTIKTMEVKR